MTPPHILVILAADAVPAGLRAALDRIQCSAAFWPLGEALRHRQGFAADALVLVLPKESAEVQNALRALLGRLGQRPCPTLVLGPAGCPPELQPAPATLPVVFDTGEDEQSLAVRLETLLELRGALAAGHRDAAASHRGDNDLAQRYAGQLRLASQVQRGFLPQRLPRFGPVSFECLFRPVDYVSGDIYDVKRLDEDHIGIALADASGHGIPAALLTVYIKRALRGKEVGDGTYRVLSPDEVLRGLNEDVLEARLSECPFVAATYAVLNTRTLEVRLARAGAPYPLHRTHCGELHVIDVAGSVVGVLAQAHFAVRQIQLAPGDSLLIHSDGLERVIGSSPGVTRERQSLRAAAERITNLNLAAARAMAPPPDATRAAVPTTAAIEVAAGSELSSAACGVCLAEGGAGEEGPKEWSDNAPSHATHPESTAPRMPAHDTSVVPADAVAGKATDAAWYETLRVYGPRAALEQLAGRQRTLRRMGFPLDDLTVLAIQIDP